MFFNYAFLVVWLADCVWWWLRPSSYEARPMWVGRSIHGFLFFMFFNGAIVFADGWMRLLGIIAVGAVSIAWLTELFEQKVPAH